MTQTFKVRLETTSEQYEVLKNTMSVFNKAMSEIACWAAENEISERWAIQAGIYHTIRERYDLSAQMTVRAIKIAADAQARIAKGKTASFKPWGPVVYDSRTMSFKGSDQVSLWTIHGRIKIQLRLGEYQRACLALQQGEADLLLQDGVYYLAITLEGSEPIVPADSLGIVSLAADSDGESCLGALEPDAPLGTRAISPSFAVCGRLRPLATDDPLPTFRYYPGPDEDQTIEKSPIECAACRQTRGCIVTAVAYGLDVPDDAMFCPWCVADGLAHRLYDVTFNEVEIGVGPEVRAEVEQRTPGFLTWQDWDWPTHCEDVGVYLGQPTGDELRANREAHDALLADLAQWDWGLDMDYVRDFIDALGEHHVVYLFECPQCSTQLVRWDMD